MASDGKFRVRRCKIVGEVNLSEIGLVNDKPNNKGAAKIGSA